MFWHEVVLWRSLEAEISVDLVLQHMEVEINLVPRAQQPGTRRCAFQLCIAGGSVYMDLDMCGKSLQLARISFDGYGCCQPGPCQEMDASDAEQLKALLAGGLTTPADKEAALAIVRKYLREIKGVLWEDALQEHGLL